MQKIFLDELDPLCLLIKVLILGRDIFLQKLDVRANIITREAVFQALNFKITISLRRYTECYKCQNHL